MSLPRLLVLASTYPRWRGDSEPGFVHQLSRRLAEHFEVHVICPHADGSRGAEIIDAVRVHRFRYAPASLETLVSGGGILGNLKKSPWKWMLVPFFLAGLTLGAYRLVRRLRPDVIHAHWIIPQGLAVAVLRRVITDFPPLLLTCHGGDLFALRGRLLARLKRWILRHADAVSVVSTPMRRLVTDLGVNDERVFVLPMGVAMRDLFVPGDEAMRQEHEILFVGRLVEKKGLAYLVRALPMVLEKFPQATLTVAGYGPERPALEALASSLGVADRIRFIGAQHQQDLPALYQRAAVFVAPFVQARSGDQEGLPVALMEAIACGCPVVTGTLDVLDDIFGADEREWQVDPRDVPALAARITEVLRRPDHHRRCIRQVRQRLATHVDWEVVAAGYSRVLREVWSGTP